jgi:hypothetical protein
MSESAVLQNNQPSPRYFDCHIGVHWARRMSEWLP